MTSISPTRALVVAVAMVAAISVEAHPAAAQTCDRSCSVRLRDAAGCCPSVSKPAGAPAAAPPCPRGQERSADTAGNCCWPGQAWSGSACVGTPTRCPEGHHVDAPGQLCALTACEAGTERTVDGNHCCYPGQAWSQSQSRCIGLPRCPAGTEASGEACITDDQDGDGIVNAADRCPAEAEDRDGFQDADGCPDGDNDGDGVADAADPCPENAEDENLFQDEDGCPDDPQRLEREAVNETSRVQLKEQNAARARSQATEADETARSRASTLNTLGWVLGGSGLVLVGSGFAFSAVASGEAALIEEGSLSTGSDIETAASNSVVLDSLSYAAWGLGGAAVLTGVGLLVWGPDAPPDRIVANLNGVGYAW